MQNPRQPRSVCHGFCWGQPGARNPCAGRSPPGGARDPCAGHSPPGGARDPCAGHSPPGGARDPCAGHSPPGGARDPCAGHSPPAAALARPAIRGFPAGRQLPPCRARTSRGSAPQRASQGEGRATPPLMLSPPLLGAIVSGARQYVLREIISLRPPHCSRRSRTKFFAEAFFQKGREVFRRGLFSKRPGSFSLRPFFKKAGKFFAEAFFQKGREVFR